MHVNIPIFFISKNDCLARICFHPAQDWLTIGDSLCPVGLSKCLTLLFDPWFHLQIMPDYPTHCGVWHRGIFCQLPNGTGWIPVNFLFGVLNKLFGTNFPLGPTFNPFLEVPGGLINIFGRVDCLTGNTKPLGDLHWAVTSLQPLNNFCSQFFHKTENWLFLFDLLLFNVKQRL